jgi:hypothetical protein
VLGRDIERRVRRRQEAEHGTDIGDATAPLVPQWGTTARVVRTIPKKFVSKIDRA